MLTDQKKFKSNKKLLISTIKSLVKNQKFSHMLTYQKNFIL